MLGYGIVLVCTFSIWIRQSTSENENSLPLNILPRVYLAGGASALGNAEDTIVVYTPAVIGPSLYATSIPLAHGHFVNDVFNPFEPGKFL